MASMRNSTGSKSVVTVQRMADARSPKSFQPDELKKDALKKIQAFEAKHDGYQFDQWITLNGKKLKRSRFTGGQLTRSCLKLS